MTRFSVPGVLTLVVAAGDVVALVARPVGAEADDDRERAVGVDRDLFVEGAIGVGRDHRRVRQACRSCT